MSTIQIENVPNDVLLKLYNKCSAAGLDPNDVFSLWIHFIVSSPVPFLCEMFRGFPHEA